jgi:hypothetical protein
MNIDSRKLKPGEYVFGTLVSRDLYPSREFSSYASTKF